MGTRNHSKIQPLVCRKNNSSGQKPFCKIPMKATSQQIPTKNILADRGMVEN